MQVAELKPMGIGDILDTTFKLYVRRFLSFLLIVLVVYLPYALVISYIQSSLLELQQPGFTPASYTLFPYQAQAAPEFDPTALLAVFVPLFLFWFIANPLMQGALIQSISASYLGEQISAVTAYRRALPRLFRLILANILAGIIILIGFILLIVPGIIFSLWFMLVSAVVMLETNSVTGSLGRSRELMRGNLGKGFLLGLVVLLLFYIYAIIVGVVMGALNVDSPFVYNFVNNIVNVPIIPIQLGVVILLYYDLRIRKEGFDVQQLAAAIGSTSTTETNPSRLGER